MHAGIEFFDYVESGIQEAPFYAYIRQERDLTCVLECVKLYRGVGRR